MASQVTYRTVLGLSLGEQGGWCPLTDYTLSQMVAALTAPSSSSLSEIVFRDPTLGHWLWGQLPLGSIDALQLPLLVSEENSGWWRSRLKAALRARRLEVGQWQQFRDWWLRGAAAMRATHQRLKTQSLSTRRLAGLTALIKACPHPSISNQTASDQQSTMVAEVVPCLDGEVNSIVDDVVQKSIAGDATVGNEISLAERNGIELCLTPLHEALPRLLAMQDRLETFEHDFKHELEQEKLAAMKELAYGASHEINNPLANISSRAQVLLRDESDAERRRSLATINSQAFRAHEMIADMMLFAKPPAIERTETTVQEFMTPIVERIQQELPAGVRLNVEINSPDKRISIDTDQLAVAVHAICNNSLEAMAGAGELTVRADRDSDLVDREAWLLEVRDTGPGISDAVRRHLFDPFYSGREAGRGLGFGLSKAWRIVDSHGGSILVDSAVGQGTGLTLRLPSDC